MIFVILFRTYFTLYARLQVYAHHYKTDLYIHIFTIAFALEYFTDRLNVGIHLLFGFHAINNIMIVVYMMSKCRSLCKMFGGIIAGRCPPSHSPSTDALNKYLFCTCYLSGSGVGAEVPRGDKTRSFCSWIFRHWWKHRC